MWIRTLGLVCFLSSLDLAFSQLACPTGKWGADCELTCDANCKLNCERVKGTCYDCKEGWYDSHCDRRCVDCKFGCDQKTGLCECDVYGCETCSTSDPSKCDVCDSTKNFIHNINAQERCCSDGCGRGLGGITECNSNGTCSLGSCEGTGYWGAKCIKCSETIEHCESCNRIQNTETLICTKCWPSYVISSDQKRCCPEGCDDCQTLDLSGNGAETDICSVCKPGFYIYGERCDNCGGNCQSPSAGPPEARCDSVTGACLYGCLPSWHGSKCDVKCNLANCETCQYDDSNLSLTCMKCVEGWAPHPVTGLCEQCNSNCEQGRCNPGTGYCTLGCVAGWRSDRCDEPCVDAGLGNCTICGRDTLTCNECMFNNWGPVCEYECSPHCFPEEGTTVLDHICVKDTAECNAGCFPGYWREDCRLECPNCLNDTCKIEDGTCTEEACKPGFWDDNCGTACSPYCATNSASGEQECSFKNGFCTHGCTYNTHGDTCLQPCNPNCYDNRTEAAIQANEPLCAQNNGQCLYECKKGFYTFDCSKACESTCVTDDCGFVEGYCVACDWVPKGQACYDGACTIGEYGTYCNMSCPGGEMCMNNTCDRYTAYCDGCVTGQWGDYCEKNCSTCLDGICAQKTGICTRGCNDGYFGQACLDHCSNRCDRCDRIDGSCLVCSESYYGPVCEHNCSDHCALMNGKLLCDKGNGKCTSGACAPGYFGLKCEDKCYDNCLATEGNAIATCNYNTGYCTNGCVRGWYGLLCTGECSATCRNKTCYEDSNNCLDGCTDKYWGPQCLQDCGRGCNHGQCDDFGVCLAGCIEKRYGPTCNETCHETCIDNFCDQQTGNCSECTKQQPSKLCRTAMCNQGLYGLQCDIQCPSTTCLDNRCNRDNGTCEGCNIGLYGAYCRSECPNCVNGACSQDTGKCMDGCLDRWYGDRCDMECQSCIKCNRRSGQCTLCPAGKHGNACQHDCSSNCLSTQDGYKSCDLNTAACASEACASGFYGYDCVTPCHSNCGANDDEIVLCDFATGACSANCTKLFYGPHCEKDCESYCHDKTCHRTEGICEDCKPIQGCLDCLLPPNCPDAICNTGFWGQTCLDPCPERCDSLGCDRYTARCVNCQPGFHGDKCTDVCTYQGCYTCVQSTGDCESCNAGKYGINCDLDCGGCAPVNGEVRCDMITGNCLTDVCQPGKWGIYCAKDCNENCADSNGDNLCDKLYGECLLGCDKSYFGALCDQECSPMCKSKNCKESANDCQEGCAAGYFGLPSCLTECSRNCINNNCTEDDGFCIDGCANGYYLDQCSTVCEETCTNNKCDRATGRCPECTETTSNPYYFCKTKECEVGKRGNMCDKLCHENCAEKCDRYTGRCDGCDSYYYGTNCTLECRNCVDGLCDQDGGVCEKGCQAGYFDPKCAQSCIFDGCETCDREFGLCLTCKVQNAMGLFGTACEKVCSSHCTPSDEGYHLCDKDTGDCQEGSCLVEWWGSECNQQCNANCKENDNGFRSCYYRDGTCSSGCKDYFWGDQCDKDCSDRCVGKLCDRDSKCLVDCVPGAYGPSCEFECTKTCNDGTCDRDFGNCTECDKPLNQQTELCRTAHCQVGRQGLFCNETCPEHCESSCDRYNSTCDGCNPGFYNDTCDYICGFCAAITCNQITGKCDVGCADGYWGDLCIDECLHPDCRSCSRDDGECSICFPGKHGQNCSDDCGSACAASSDGYVYCNKETGACREGLCSPGWFGADCSLECPDYCAPIQNGETYCDFQSGSCNYGCLPGWYSDLCNVTCNTNCAGGLCTRSGFCIDGCIETTYGYFCEMTCDETCNNNMCDRDTGRCEECYVVDRQQTFECRDAACPSGFQGLFCDEPCPSGCQDTCQRYIASCASCKSGYYGDHCNVTCGNCFLEACEQHTGNCNNGCLDEWYGLQCLQQCIDPNCQTCDIFTGTCLECKPSYYGFNCAKSCSSFCAPIEGTNSVRCDMETGFCGAEKCESGYYGKDCSRRCNETCGADFNGKRPCDLLTGRCQYDCVPSWHGDTCDRKCSQQCAQGVCNRTGFCIGELDLACQPGYYGGDCRLACFEPKTCNDGRCHRFNGNCSACDDPPKAPECRDAECPEGTWGLNCDQTCPPNCEGGVCIREIGLCKDCLDTWYGDKCDSQCRNCQDDVCFQSNGNCIRDCKDGWYTRTCNTPCLHTGCRDCTRDNGTCVDCKIGKYKDDCSVDCSPHCALTDNGLECIKSSGICKSGQCKTGYWHETCVEECSPYCDTDGCELSSGACSPCKLGWFGTACRQKCSENCKNENCTGTYDSCLEGCKDGFWGPTCDYKCNLNCLKNRCDINTGECSIGCEGDMFYGPTCKESCNANCATENGNQGGNCDRTGYCRTDCVTGTYGDNCENACPPDATCTDGTCDRKNGNCSACDAIDPDHLCPTAECPTGKWGKDCEKFCSSNNCLYNRCTRDGDVCMGCPIGLYSTKCDKTCGNCKVGTGCDQISGTCREGCRDGFQGDKCDEACASNCQSCERYGDPKKCVTCIENKWGPNCEDNCNSNCAKSIEGSLAVTRCDKDTGHCSEGACKDNRFWQYNCTKVCPQNCLPVNGVRTCKIHNGACTGGCQDTYFGTKCDQECSVQCRGKICVNSRNNCVNGCEQGYYNPPTCSGTCSAWCKNPGNIPGNEICNPNTGSCLYGCVDGYFGEKCIEQCYGKCKDGTCDDLGGCPDCRISPVGDMCHPQVCPYRKYGPSCESECPGNYCKNNTCHRQSGECPQGCQEWHYGDYCSEKCICDRAGALSCSQDGVCECKSGYSSVDCSQRCSDGCQNNLCDKSGQCTLGCIAGRYGAQCDGRCSNCVDESCNPSTGHCTIGCKPGYFGTRCEDACADNCLSCQSDAACTSCVAFRYGLPTCTQTCNSNCKEAASSRICSESSGACIEGCKNGHYGNQCDRTCNKNCGGNAACSIDGDCLDGCRPGYFQSKCDANCSSGCASGGTYNARECDITSGACKYGCQSGYYGSTCLKCSNKCLDGKCSSANICTDGCEDSFYGKNDGCSRECTNCKNGKCDDEGTCQEGCMDRFYGTKCETFCIKTCKDDSCDQTSGECADCSSTPVGSLCRDIAAQTAAQVEVDERLSMGAIIGISAGCAGAVVIIVILVVCCVFYRRQATDARNEIHLPSDVLERLSTHRSHHSTISSQYPVARVVGDDEKDFVLF